MSLLGLEKVAVSKFPPDLGLLALGKKPILDMTFHHPRLSPSTHSTWPCLTWPACPHQTSASQFLKAASLAI